MQIYTERIEEAYDGHYVCFVDRRTGGEVLWSSGVEKNRKINERPHQLLGI